MYIEEAIKKLQAIREKHGDDLQILVNDPEAQGIVAACSIELREAEEGEYPEDYQLPAGTKFIELSTW